MKAVALLTETVQRAFFVKYPAPPLRLASDVIAELELYSVEALRQARAATPQTLIRLRNACVSRDEIESWIKWKKAVVRWQEHRDTRRFQIMLWLGVVTAALAALAALR